VTLITLAAQEKARPLRRALKESMMRLRVNEARTLSAQDPTPSISNGTRVSGAGGFAICASGQYRISNIKYAVSIMAVTLATESTKASCASW